MDNNFRSFSRVTCTGLVIYAALFMLAFDNAAYFRNIVAVYPVSARNIWFLLSLAIGSASLIVLVLSFVSHRYLLKPALVIMLMLSSCAAYFMDSYNVVINDSMIRNIVNTDEAEVLDLLNIKLFLYILLLGLLPSWYVYRVKINFKPGWRQVLSSARLFSIALLTLVLVIYVFSDFYSSFFREHKILRFYANPAYYIYSTGKYINGLTRNEHGKIRIIGQDAEIPASDNQNELVIFVLGETARAEDFSLNGYARETNPLLEKSGVISFPDFWSCATSTEFSVPCMFSMYDKSHFSIEKAKTTENLLDVLSHAGVSVLWLDNNSGSKGVADRVPHFSYRKPDINTQCDTECRDIGMLDNLQSYINEHSHEDIFIVLHQMGNHGPAYYKRYPPGFEKFTPVCKTDELQDCTDEEIRNAYDNAILYTDYFLSKVIGILKNNNKDFETAMFYVSDHGESLGEAGIYLHGYPDFLAPEQQTHIPAIFWAGSVFNDIDMESISSISHKKYSHDNIFHSILGIFEINSSVYDSRLDIFRNDTLHPLS